MTLPTLMLNARGSRDRAGAVSPTVSASSVEVKGPYEYGWQLPRASVNRVINPLLVGADGSSANFTWETITEPVIHPSGLVIPQYRRYTVISPTTNVVAISIAASGLLTQGQAWAGQYIVRLKAASYGPGKFLRMLIWESGGASAAETTAFGDTQSTTLSDGDWHLVSGTGTVKKADRTSLALYVQMYGVVAGDIIEVVAFQAEETAFRTPYHDGTMSGSTWTATAHNSSSSRAAGIVSFTSLMQSAVGTKEGSALIRYYEPYATQGSQYLFLVGAWQNSFISLVRNYSGGLPQIATFFYGPTGSGVSASLTLPTSYGWNTALLTWSQSKVTLQTVSNYAEATPQGPYTLSWVGKSATLGTSSIQNADTSIETLVFYDYALTQTEGARALNQRFTWDMLEPQALPQAPAIRGRTTLEAELWRHTPKNLPLEDITSTALTAKVSMNGNADIKGTMSLKVFDPTRVTAFSDCLAPFLKITDANGVTTRHQMGLYVFPPSKGTHLQGGSTGQLEGYDMTWYLAHNHPSGLVNYAASANVVEAVRAIFDAHGLNHNIPSSPLTFGADRTYHPDKSWLQIANDMLNGIGYYTAWADRYGTGKSRPYFELATAQPTLELYSGEGSLVIGAIEQEGTFEGLANKIVVYKANTQGDPIISTRINSDPASPISTVNMGRTITRLISDSQIASQAVADAMAQRYLEESASYTNKLSVTTLPAPERDLHEVYDLAIYNAEDTVIGFGKWWCDQWESAIGFRPVQATMVHKLKRLEPYGGTSQ